MDIKLPDGFENKEEAMEALIKKEIDAAESELFAVRQDIEKFLFEKKGYSASEIEKDVEFEVLIGDERCKSRADIVISIDDKKLVLIKCSVGALGSRERQAVACARVLDSYQIPFAVVTDAVEAIALDTLTGKVISEGMVSIPSRNELGELLQKIEFKKLPSERTEKEKRILLAFDSIKCTINYGE
ncbi:MAG: type I restriction enzyme HsdR N-terminal domain-containing protein [Thermodesulfovibrionales bacterium]|nr:type I restriction enzyme HsdR N-terminal domain-containing protein [Thermodesulfovibrionales bacterium]